MTIRFYLHSKVYANSPKRAIYIEIRFPQQPAAYHTETLVLRKSTGKKCDPAHFTDKQRVKKDTKAHDINSRLNKLEQWAGEVIDQAKLDKSTLTPELLWERMLARDEDAPPPPAPKVAEPGAELLRELGPRWVARYKNKFSENHLRKMTPLINHWEAFRPGTTVAELKPDPNTGESDLVLGWVNYLVTEAPQPRGGFGMENNSAGGYIRWLRLLLKFAGQPYDWLKDDLTYEVEIEPLTYAEVVQLYEAPLAGYLARCRDYFVFNCLTGPRYENLAGIMPSDVKEERLPSGQRVLVLSYVQHKGRDKHTVRVVLDTMAEEIWHRYGGQLRVPVNQDMNRDIKEAGKRAGLGREILQVRQKANKRIERRGPLYEFLTCHTARHTYATLLLDGGANLGEVQNSLGHSNIQNTRRYAKTREKERHVSTLSAFEKLRASHTEG